MDAPETTRDLLRITHSDFPAHIVGITADETFVLREEAKNSEPQFSSSSFDGIVKANPALFHIHEDWCYFEFLSEGINLGDFFRALRFDSTHESDEDLIDLLENLDPALSAMAEAFAQTYDEYIFTPAFVTWQDAKYWVLLTEHSNGHVFMGALDHLGLVGHCNVAEYFSDYELSFQRQLIDLGHGNWMKTQWGEGQYSTDIFHNEHGQTRVLTDWIKEVEATALAAILLEFEPSNGLFDATEIAAIEKSIDIIKTRHATLTISLDRSQDTSHDLRLQVQEHLRQESRAYQRWYEFFTNEKFTQRETHLAMLTALENGETQWLEHGDYRLDY